MNAIDEKRVILFDGVCVLCELSVRFIVRHDSNGIYRFAALQSEAGRRFLSRLMKPLDELETDGANDFVLLLGDRAMIKSSAWLEVLTSFGGWWRLAHVLKLVPRPVRDWCYDLIGRHRYRLFGRNAHCIVPDRDIRHRFIE